VSNSIPEAKMAATVLLLPELEANDHCAAAQTLAAIFCDNLYLVSEHPIIPSVYYTIPSVANQCEQALAKAKEKLLFWGKELGIPQERCLLVLSKYSLFTKNRLQQQLVRQLNCPVQILEITADEPWYATLENALAIPNNIPAMQIKKLNKVVKIRSLTRSSVLS